MTETGPVSALSKHPELAKQIAALISHYANIEYRFFMTYSAIATTYAKTVTASDVNQCFSAFYKMRSVNNKTGLLLQVAWPRVDPLRYRALERLCRRFKGAASRRTDVAHCVFMAKDDGPLWRLSTAKPEPSFEILNQSYIDRTSLQFRTLGRDASTFLTFVVGNYEKGLALLRALPLPPGGTPPPGLGVPRAPPDQHEKDERKASVSRLGLLPLYKD